MPHGIGFSQPYWGIFPTYKGSLPEHNQLEGKEKSSVAKVIFVTYRCCKRGGGEFIRRNGD